MSRFIKVRQFQGQEQIGFLTSPLPSKPARSIPQQALVSQELDGDVVGGGAPGDSDPHLGRCGVFVLVGSSSFMLQALMEALHHAQGLGAIAAISEVVDRLRGI